MQPLKGNCWHKESAKAYCLEQVNPGKFMPGASGKSGDSVTICSSPISWTLLVSLRSAIGTSRDGYRQVPWRLLVSASHQNTVLSKIGFCKSGLVLIGSTLSAISGWFFVKFESCGPSQRDMKMLCAPTQSVSSSPPRKLEITVSSCPKRRFAAPQSISPWGVSRMWVWRRSNSGKLSSPSNLDIW